MKNEIKELIEDFYRYSPRWEGDIIDLSDVQKDTLCYEWLRAYTSWLDDHIPCCIIGTDSQIEFLDMLYIHGKDVVSLRLKDAIYLSLECTLRERVQDHFDEEYAEAEPFAGYEAGQ